MLQSNEVVCYFAYVIFFKIKNNNLISSLLIIILFEVWIRKLKKEQDIFMQTRPCCLINMSINEILKQALQL